MCHNLELDSFYPNQFNVVHNIIILWVIIFQLGVEPEQTASSKKRRPSRDSDILRIYTPKIVAKFSPKDVTQARSRSPILEGEEKEVELAGQEVLDWNLPNLKLHGKSKDRMCI